MKYTYNEYTFDTKAETVNGVWVPNFSECLLQVVLIHMGEVHKAFESNSKNTYRFILKCGGYVSIEVFKASNYSIGYKNKEQTSGYHQYHTCPTTLIKRFLCS